MGRGLTREKLVETALAIVDRDGLQALSMRRLGAELGVDPMAAYRHLPNKDALLDGVMEAVIAEVDLDVDTTKPWQEQLRQLAHANLAALLAHPNAAPLLAGRPLTTPRALRLVERALEVMTSAGIPLREAGLTVNALGVLTTTVASAMSASAGPPEERMRTVEAYLSLPAEEFPVLVRLFASNEAALTMDAVFDYVLDAIVEKLETVSPA